MENRILPVLFMIGWFVAACKETSPPGFERSLAPRADLTSVETQKAAVAVIEASPFIEITNEAPPSLSIDPPIADGLARGVFWAQYRVENIRIIPVFGPGALKVSPRVGHLHITVDDLPWWWPEASGNNTIDIAGFPPGPHKVRISLMNSNHQVFPGQSKTIKFTIPERPGVDHSH